MDWKGARTKRHVANPSLGFRAIDKIPAVNHIRAKYSSICKICDRPYPVGTEIALGNEKGKGRWLSHWSCYAGLFSEGDK